MKNHIWVRGLGLGVCVALVSGCLGDARLDAADADAPYARVEREQWESAETGCEDVDTSHAAIATAAGAPGLGVLVDDEGHVLCVDSLAVLIDELGPLPEITPTSADPSPQPSHPGMDRVGSTRMALSSSDGARRDPTPTPVVRARRPDPTPTPIDQPDPTPTPMMEN